MSITATYNGQTYSNVTSLVASDGTSSATVTLTESGGGGSVGGLTEYNKISDLTLTELEHIDGVDTVRGVKIAHGLTKAPKLFTLRANITDAYTDHKGIAVAAIGILGLVGTDICFMLSPNSKTGALSSGSPFMPPSAGFVNEYSKYKVDDTYIWLTRISTNTTYVTTVPWTLECWA